MKKLTINFENDLELSQIETVLDLHKVLGKVIGNSIEIITNPNKIESIKELLFPNYNNHIGI